jgi:serine/threonine protein kinase, bacterial
MSTASTLVSNRYRVVRELGKGGFGATFLVEDTQLPSGKRCVLKELLPIVDSEETCALIQQRFEREAVILEELGNVSPQIPSLYAYFSEDSKFYLVQEYVEGDTLGHRVASQGVMGDAAVREWLAGILPVLDCVHGKRIIHRDIKPDNIILRQRDHKPVLIDFGAVRETMGTQLNGQGKSTQSIVIGTPGFMPSEQAIGRAVFASDLYSLGLTAIYALTGKIPQELPTDPLTGEVQWRQFAPMVSAGLAGVIDGAIVPGIQGRFQTSGQMLDALVSSDVSSQMPGTVVSARGGAMPTQVSRVPVNSSMPTVVAAPLSQSGNIQYSQPNSSSSQSASSQSNGDFKTSIITGGIIGVSILLGSIVMKGQVPDLAFQTSSNEETGKVTHKEKAENSEKPKEEIAALPPVQQPTQTVIVQAAQPAPVVVAPAVTPVVDLSEMNSTIVGKAGSKNIRSGPGTINSVLYSVNPGDRVKVVGTGNDEGRNPWYKVITANGVDGWIASQLIQRDGEVISAPVNVPPEVVSQPKKSSNDTNATIAGSGGSKNVRTGPGTRYPTQHTPIPPQN